MNLNIVVLNFNIVLLYMSIFYECKQICSNYTEEFINLAVISDYVYIGGKNSLIQLNSSLDIVNIKPMEGSNWLLTPYTKSEEETILIACDYKGEYDSECTGYRSDLSIDNGYKEYIMIKKPHARYTTTTIGSENKLTIASSDCLKRSSSSDPCYAISNYYGKMEPFNDKEPYTVRYLDAKNNNKFIFDFRTVVGNGKYTYFLFVFNHTVSKLGKICNDTKTHTNSFNAYEDVPIFCSYNGVNFTTATDLMFWNDDLLVVFTDGSGSVICKFTKLYDNFEISRIERLKCPFKKLENKYFYNSSLTVCYDQAKNKCQSNANPAVSILVSFIVYINEIARGDKCHNNNKIAATCSRCRILVVMSH